MDRPVLHRGRALSRYLGDIPTIITPISFEAADNATRARILAIEGHSLSLAHGDPEFWKNEIVADRKPRRSCFSLVSRSAVHLKTVELAGVTASSLFASGANINKSEHDR